MAELDTARQVFQRLAAQACAGDLAAMTELRTAGEAMVEQARMFGGGLEVEVAGPRSRPWSSRC